MATNFFDQQDAARRKTGLLIVYFALAVLAIILTVYFVASALILLGLGPGDRHSTAVFDPGRMATVATLVSIVIVAGSLYRIAMLREGGAAVARLLGGQPVNPASTALAERRLLNVVEEMALASGVPVPTVYLLDGEPGINAFAAGFTPGDAVIAVSQGCLDHLTRDELQGVVAHEFSHLLNGDMRLNVRLMGLLHGILLIALIGQLLMRMSANSPGASRRDRDGRGSTDRSALFALLMGLALLAIGWIGVFFGRLIQAAVSRQREFLADSSAVQFTRNPDGIAGALKKIGGLATGSRIRDPHAEEAGHLFFSEGVPSLSALLATHPPLIERIRRIDPSFDGRFVPPDSIEAPQQEAERPSAGVSRRFEPLGAISFDSSSEVAGVGAPPGRAHVDFAAATIAALPAPLLEAVREPFSARAVVYALLLDPEPRVRWIQLSQIENQADRGTLPLVEELRPMLATLDSSLRLPLIELALPALRELSSPQYEQFRARVADLVASDRKVSLFEFALERMLTRHLDRHFRGRTPPEVRYHSIGALSDDWVLLLSALAHAGQADRTAAVQAFTRGKERLGVPRDPHALVPRQACSIPALDRALDRLATASPQVRKRVLDAGLACIASDRRVTVAERELLRAVADSLDCPMPPSLAQAPDVPESTPDPMAPRPSPLPS